jgi:alanine-glyoxylate transaminase/serine-glyoxylate transaminase/serine-pyruvate transaminase
MTYQAGRHFLQVPGPSNIPDRILRAIAQPVLDHRGPAWAKLQAEILRAHPASLQDQASR